ncbi:hypothetical protein KC330_g124 [Hortaea werneckii]|nr:hypothetical protein KC330_g124 [Hortaea werneckii]
MAGRRADRARRLALAAAPSLLLLPPSHRACCLPPVHLRTALRRRLPCGTVVGLMNLAYERISSTVVARSEDALVDGIVLTSFLKSAIFCERCLDASPLRCVSVYMLSSSLAAGNGLRLAAPSKCCG